MKSNLSDLTGYFQIWTFVQEKFIRFDYLLKTLYESNIQRYKTIMAFIRQRSIIAWNHLKTSVNVQKKELGKTWNRLVSNEYKNAKRLIENGQKFPPFKILCNELEKLSLGFVEQVQHLQYVQIDLQRKSESIMQQEQAFLKTEILESYWETEEEITRTIKLLGKVIDEMGRIERSFWKKMYEMDSILNTSSGNSETNKYLANAVYIVVDTGRLIQNCTGKLMNEIKKSPSPDSLGLLKRFNKNIAEQTIIMVQSSQQIEMLASLVLLEREFALHASM